MKIGDKVKIIHSPYHKIKVGTISTIVDIRNLQYGKRHTTYVLKVGYSFYEWELEKINDKEE